MIIIKNKAQFLIFSVIIGIFIFGAGDRIGEAYRIAEGDMLTKINYVSDNITPLLLSLRFSFDFNDILWGLSAAFCWALFVIYELFARTNFRNGEEHGSARWGEKADIRKLVDKVKYNNMIFSMSVQISINTRQTMRSNNILVIGGTGTGKTRFFLKPNIMQMHSSYVVTDPNGLIYRGCNNFINWRCL